VTLANTKPRYSETINPGDEFEVKLGIAKAEQTVFKGEVTGIEPTFIQGDQRVVIRGLNYLHRLTRGKKSVAYVNVTDKDIVKKVCEAHGLSAVFGNDAPTQKYPHVYQHNMTDLEFLRARGALVGCQVYVDFDKKLHFGKRTEKVSSIKLELGGAGGQANLERFMPRLSTANQVSKVIVRGYDPKTKKEIIGEAERSSSKLGDETGTKVTNQSHPDVQAVYIEVPVRDKQHADNIAKGLLEERLMKFITGEGVAQGNPELAPGLIIEVSVNDGRFNGKYHVMAVRHRYVHGGPLSYRTEFKFERDAHSKP
jgi:phage protein D